MNTDIRLNIGFLDHPKIVKLQRRLGPEAVLSLIRLWIYTAMNKPDGKLVGMDEEDIEIASCWENTDSILAVLLELSLVKKNGKYYYINDWEEHNSWAAGYKDRSEKARKAVNKRWLKEKKKQEFSGDTTSIQAVYNENADSNTPFLSFPYLTLPYHISNSKEFADSWILWEKYRREKKKTLTKSTIEKQIKMLSSFSPQKASDVILQSIQNGWTGLFPDKIEDRAEEEKMWANIGKDYEQ